MLVEIVVGRRILEVPVWKEFPAPFTSASTGSDQQVCLAWEVSSISIHKSWRQICWRKNIFISEMWNFLEGKAFRWRKRHTFTTMGLAREIFHGQFRIEKLLRMKCCSRFPDNFIRPGISTPSRYFNSIDEKAHEFHHFMLRHQSEHAFQSNFL